MIVGPGMGFACRAAVACGMVLWLAMPHIARAHTAENDRHVTAQIDDAGVALLWQVSVSGPRVQLLVGLHDRNGDGTIAADESRRLAAAVLAPAMRGTRVKWDGRVLPVTTLDTRIVGQPTARGFKAVGLATLATPTARASDGPVAAHTLSFELSESERDGLSVQIQSLGAWTLSPAPAGIVGDRPTPHRMASDGRGLDRPVQLGPGRGIVVGVQRTPQDAGGQAKSVTR